MSVGTQQYTDPIRGMKEALVKDRRSEPTFQYFSYQTKNPIVRHDIITLHEHTNTVDFSYPVDFVLCDG